MHALFIIREIPDYHLKGRDFMNIFKEKSDFIGRYDLETENSFYSFFCLAEQIRSKLGTQGYLLDHYLSLIFTELQQTYDPNDTNADFEPKHPYQALCMSILDGGEKEKDHSLYFKTLSSAIHSIKNTVYQEYSTKLELLYSSMADDFFDDAICKYINKQSLFIDLIQLSELYEQISHIVGTSLMETLTLKLKQKFLPVPRVTLFAQGFINDLLNRLTTRDIETNKQIFQLILDRISENKK